MARNAREDRLAQPEELWERLDPGSEVPAGECPDCGALAYLAENPQRMKLDDLLERALAALAHSGIDPTFQADISRTLGGEK